MDILGAIAISEGALAVLFTGTWFRVLRRRDDYVEWRRKTSVVALILPSIAFAVLFAFTTVPLRYIEALDSASRNGGWYAFVSHICLWSFFATGPLSFGGVVLGILGKGNPRILGIVWSCLVLVMFFINFVLFVNSFH